MREQISYHKKKPSCCSGLLVCLLRKILNRSCDAVAGLGHLISLPKPRSLPLPGATQTGGMGPQWGMSRRLSAGGRELSWEEY